MASDGSDLLGGSDEDLKLPCVHLVRIRVRVRMQIRVRALAPGFETPKAMIGPEPLSALTCPSEALP